MELLMSENAQQVSGLVDAEINEAAVRTVEGIGDIGAVALDGHATPETQNDNPDEDMVNAGNPITDLETSLPMLNTPSAEKLRQGVGRLLDEGYTFAEGRSYHTITGPQEYATSQEAQGRTVLHYYSGGQMDVFSFSPPVPSLEQ